MFEKVLTVGCQLWSRAGGDANQGYRQQFHIPNVNFVQNTDKSAANISSPQVVRSLDCVLPLLANQLPPCSLPASRSDVLHVSLAKHQLCVHLLTERSKRERRRSLCSAP
jgi:hypothetical protein